MTYTPYLIAQYATGYDKELQPWLLPDDAYFELLDGYVYRGVTNKRDGYSGYANGIKSTYTESRMVHEIAAVAPATGVIDGANRTFTWTLTPPLARGRVVITGSNPSQSFTDNGQGYFLLPTINIFAVGLTNPASITTSVNHGYTTGDQVVISGVGGTIELNSALAYTITVTSLNQFTLNGVNATMFTPYTSGGIVAKVIGSIIYSTGAVSITFPVAPAAASTVLLTYSYYPGLPVMGVMNFFPTNNLRELIVADTRFVNRYNPSTDRLDDIPAGSYNGTSKDFWSWVNYEDASSNPRLLFSNGVVGDVIQVYDGSTIADYAPTFAGGTLNAAQMFNFKDRLILFKTVEGGVLFPRRIRVSGTGANCDNFDDTATGAGAIDIPDNTWFFGAAFNRDDILFFTESSTWALKYTGNDITPFSLQRIDNSRGSGATFSVISYLNRTMAASPRGLIICDGYQVDRMDDNIPKFSFDDIDDANFEHCFAGFIDEDRDVYTLYPSDGVIKPPLVPIDGSDRILVTNFEEDNYAIYRLPLSTMGNFRLAFTLLWSDLTAAAGFSNWDAFADKFGNWNAFPFDKFTPVAIGGGHKGEIWRLNDTENEDNPQKIRDITVLNDQKIRVTTDWNNYEVGDFISFEAVGGMTEINDKQGQIVNIQTNYTVFDVDFGQSHGGFSTYTSGGIASRSIPFQAITKKFNPWINADKKLRCGWIYFYVSVTETDLTDWDVASTPIPAQLIIDVLTNNNQDPDFSNPQFTYLVDCSAINNEGGDKKWVKIWINQVGQFLQFRMRNNQAGAKIQVHAIVPGFQPVGRLI